ncbi:unnamed protein product, partial [Ixodes persulcatus]
MAIAESRDVRAGPRLRAGTSDPYVKFKHGGRQVYRSRTVSRSLDPYWDECFFLPVRDLWDPLLVRVFDYDFGLQDDFMGAALVELHTLELDRCLYFFSRCRSRSASELSNI